MPIETIEDYHIKIKPSSKMIDFIINNIKIYKETPDNIISLKDSHKNQVNTFLTLNDIKWIKSYISEQNTCEKKQYICNLLEGINVQLPEPKVTPRDPKLEARIKQLQAQQDARDYKAMTKSVDSFRKHLPDETIAFQMKLINKQLVAVAQFVFSVIAAFAFGFIGIELIIGNLDFGFRLLLGIICSLVVALAEIYFLAKKLSENYDEAPSRSMSQKLHQE